MAKQASAEPGQPTKAAARACDRTPPPARWLRALAAFVALPAALCALVLLSACSDPRRVETIQIGINDFPGYELLYLAQEKGFYRDEGVAVRVVEFRSLADAMFAANNRQLDIVATTPVDLLLGQGGASPRFKAGWVIDYSDGADAIVARSPLGSVADLKGRTVALETGSIGILVLGLALQRAGLSLGDVKLLNMSTGMAESAIVAGRADAVVTYSPFLERLETKPGLRRIFDSKAIPGEIADVLAFSESMLADRAQDARRVVRALLRAQSFLREQPGEALAIMAAREHLGVEQFRLALEVGLHLEAASDQSSYFDSGGRLEKTIARSAEYLRKQGLLAGAVDARQFMTDAAVLPDATKR